MNDPAAGIARGMQSQFSQLSNKLWPKELQKKIKLLLDKKSRESWPSLSVECLCQELELDKRPRTCENIIRSLQLVTVVFPVPS